MERIELQAITGSRHEHPRRLATGSEQTHPRRLAIGPIGPEPTTPTPGGWYPFQPVQDLSGPPHATGTWAQSVPGPALECKIPRKGKYNS
jgi:hypothetical protein